MDFLKQLMVSKINECNRLAQQASDEGEWDKANKYEAAYFRLLMQFDERFIGEKIN